ncbi:regulatory protein RecX [Xylanibacter muris]|uniref:Regulatory protein RecX n=1 Tax=Xylanibacter muris TaxID=2736290 RepID=A0ABX2ARC6_9BACT|nr:regulatory protein RecX [Xylanibacter muris]NPD93240.1 RecX family transcriptional regulator [Xylanibacter muris]
MELTEREALLRLTSLCSQAEHCSYEMEEKMRRWGLGPEEQAGIMKYLIDNKFIDDRRFARVFAIDKIRYNKWGSRKVDQAMWAKHIDEEIRRETLAGIDEKEYMDVLRPLIKNKRKSIKTENEYEMNTKLIRFALGRGFTMPQIKECLHGDIPEEDFGE